MSGLERAQQSRRADSVGKRARVSHAIQFAVARDEVPTVTSIARAAGVDRSLFYGERGEPLRAELEVAVTRLQAELSSGVSVTGRVTAATLRADLATANELVRRLRRQVTVLEKQLSQHVGEQILAGMPPHQRAALTIDPDRQAEVDQLTLQVAELRNDKRRLEEDLDGARRANRDLTRKINAG